MTSEFIKHIIKEYSITGTDKVQLENIARWHSERDRAVVSLSKDRYKELESGKKIVYIEHPKKSFIQKIKAIWQN